MIFVDTGFLIALLSPRDSLHARAHAWVAVVSEPLLVTEYVLWELINGLSMPADRPKVHAAVDQIRAASDWEIVVASGELFEQGLRRHRERQDKAWSLTDCISFQVMQARDVRRALSYDHHFEQAGFEALLLKEPT